LELRCASAAVTLRTAEKLCQGERGVKLRAEIEIKKEGGWELPLWLTLSLYSSAYDFVPAVKEFRILSVLTELSGLTTK